MEDIGRICAENEYCTHCPARAECGVRLAFYDDDVYNMLSMEVFVRASAYAASLGFPAILIPTEVSRNIKAMDKRRERELELHPSFSKE